jgi:hypothetical protein
MASHGITEFDDAENSESEDLAVRSKLGPEILEFIDKFVDSFCAGGWVNHENGARDLQHYLQKLR